MKTKKILLLFFLLSTLHSFAQPGCVSGNCVYGQGTYIFPHGEKYIGKWKNGERNGQGTYIYHSAAVYVGEWKDGVQNGQGTWTSLKGNKYVGKWKNGKYNGQGTFTFSSGCKKCTTEELFYIMEENYDGTGTPEYPSGAKYVGEWKDGLQNGQGTFTNIKGEKVVGEWKDGNYIGYIGQRSIKTVTIPKPSAPANLIPKPTALANLIPKPTVPANLIPKPTAPADLLISNITFTDKKGNDNQLLDANENAEIKFTVANNGKGDAYNLVAEIEEINKVKGIRFLKEQTYGNLPAGKEVTISIPIYGINALETGKAEIQIIIKEGNHFDSDPFKISFNTQELKSPAIVVADYKFTGNEEGKIKLGKIVTLNIVVQNKGQGEASAVTVTLENPKDVFALDKSSFNINTLKPNESKTINYEFVANKIYKGSEIPIQVIISESYKKYGENQTLKISLEQTLTKTQQIDINSQYDKPTAIDNISLTSDVDKNIPVNNIVDENKFALIIGNEDYTSYQQGLSNEMNVEFASNDALVFKEYCMKTFGVPEKNITCLLNATAGKISQAIDKINKLIQLKNGKANVIIYYAGHGLPDENTKEPYLIPVDVSGSNISSAIKLSSFYQKLTEFPAQQITVFMDACFSGGGREAGLVAARGVRITPKFDYLNGNIVVFTACSGEESSLPWKEKQHGMFTYFILKKFQETKGDVSFSELDSFLKENISLESIRTNSKTQSPQVLFSPEEIDKWGKWKLK